MNYSVDTTVQLRAVLKALRKTRGLSQADLGQLLGVNQKRIAKIEASPGVTNWSQLARMISALGGRIAIQDTATKMTEESATSSAKRPRPSKKQATW
jgi:HTH-type transcriptional regulator/antitoxin HipB